MPRSSIVIVSGFVQLRLKVPIIDNRVTPQIAYDGVGMLVESARKSCDHFRIHVRELRWGVLPQSIRCTVAQHSEVSVLQSHPDSPGPLTLAILGRRKEAPRWPSTKSKKLCEAPLHMMTCAQASGVRWTRWRKGVGPLLLLL